MSISKFELLFARVLTNILISYKKKEEDIYDVVVKGKKRNWKIQVCFPQEFPFKLPIIYLLDKSIIGTIPHVNLSGVICIEENDSVLIDYNRPVEIINYLLEEAVKLLDRSILRIYQDDLTDEYEGYFPNNDLINSFYFAKDIPEYVNLKVAFPQKQGPKHNRPFLLYSDRELPTSFSNLDKTKKFRILKIIHIPLIESVMPPESQKNITIKYVIELFNQVADNNMVLLKELLTFKKKDEFYILLSMPRTIGERTQLLLKFNSRKKSLHPFLERTHDWAVKLYILARNNKSYLLERGGAENKLANKKVTVIGCGSVGSEIAYMLAKTGIGELTLVDPETLEADNIYRHRLGGVSLNYKPEKSTAKVNKNYKVNALSSFLLKELPYIKINSKACDFKNILQDSDFLNSNIIIIAVGAPSLSLLINRELRKLGKTKVVFCWNEAASIGGHSVSLDLKDNCYECLYSDDKEFTNNCELNLIEIGQDISKNLTGCAGVFTPFSYLDSSQTAALASQHCIDMLLYNKTSTALSWKGKNSNALRVTKRFEAMPLKEELILIKKSGCKVCNE